MSDMKVRAASAIVSIANKSDYLHSGHVHWIRTGRVRNRSPNTFHLVCLAVGVRGHDHQLDTLLVVMKLS